MELVRYAESECQAWFNANEMAPSTSQEHDLGEYRVLNLRNIFMQMDHRHPQHSSVGVDEFGWIAWEKYNSWELDT